ncbi:hypothetical protein B0J13DRAFT_591350 [Dactylonectria estremocensis]|uniref:Uncharacterized protein n=1 Tax=Dactylonectria estremocensis TaxID=1079267 RepID=A0A9P9CWZ7_9HYPO|nr:hypothetical protein B0J13DRAFT_591350 [Dactylonectria estremocensis]
METAELNGFTEWYNDDDLDYRTPELPRLGSPSPSPTNQSQPQRLALPLLQLDDWTPNLPYNEAVPTCIRYSIEWKLLLNKGRLKKLTNDTEQNLTLAPGAFWDQTLKSKLEQLLKKKTPRTKSYEPEETTIIVSVTDRTERDLSKRFDEQDIEWGVVEDQLRAWSHLLHVGKRLRIEISFICKELDTHQDVPPRILDLIYAKERESAERKRKRKTSDSEGERPIEVINPRDKAPGVYCQWHCAQINDPNWRAGFREACRITMDTCLDLRHVYADQNVDFYVAQGIKIGIARSSVGDIRSWADEVEVL